MGQWGSNRFPRYVPVAEKRALAEVARKSLEKKGRILYPAILPSPLRSWWAKAWNKNLERYADFSNRLGRGRSYARNGSVVDLQVEAGKVSALVQGSRAKPYKVEIDITTFYGPKRQELATLCGGKLDSTEALLLGRFPENMSDLLTAPGHGLFPDPRQIKFSCSCPDWADMCKHVAATLYGVGARLDEEPALFFTLRGIAVQELVGQVVEQSVKKLLRKKVVGKSQSTVLNLGDAALGKLFGLDFGKEGLTP